MHDDLPARRTVTKRGRKLGAAVRVVRIRTTPTYVVLVLADASELWISRQQRKSVVQHRQGVLATGDAPVREHDISVAELRGDESHAF